MLRKAFKLAQTERPGAIYLAIPEDVEKSELRAEARPLVLTPPRPDEPFPLQIERATDALRCTSRSSLRSMAPPEPVPATLWCALPRR